MMWKRWIPLIQSIRSANTTAQSTDSDGIGRRAITTIAGVHLQCVNHFPISRKSGLFTRRSTSPIIPLPYLCCVFGDRISFTIFVKHSLQCTAAESEERRMIDCAAESTHSHCLAQPVLSTSSSSMTASPKHFSQGL